MESDPDQAIPMDTNLLKLFVHAMQVDGEIAPSEVQKLRGFSSALGWNQDVVSQTIADEVRQPSDLGRLLDGVTDEEMQITAISVCAGIVAADGKFEEKERAFITDLCSAWGFDSSGLIESIETALEDTASS